MTHGTYGSKERLFDEILELELEFIGCQRRTEILTDGIVSKIGFILIVLFLGKSHTWMRTETNLRTYSWLGVS
jgi:hypothetical protein